MSEQDLHDLNEHELNYELIATEETTDPKPGIQTSEFWLTAIATMTGAIMSILLMYGAVDGDEAIVWQQAIVAMATVIVPVALYTWSRTRIKTAARG